MAILEYHLTKAYLRYAQGQRYGFTNPHRMLNKLDPRKEGGYRIIYDIDLEKADDNFLATALKHAHDDDPTAYLQSLESQHPIYARLKQELKNDSTGTNRERILSNMERLRWRHIQTVEPNDKHIFVNIPAQQLWAICPDSILTMRICCGAWKTKTPLLESQISYMQFNPEWNIPSSILRDEVSAHAGDSAYFARNDYFIVNRNTGDTISPKVITTRQLRSGDYRVAQHSGKSNSLGRIIFRFKNQFDVYLHDTNNHGAFDRDRRTISHGCVRVQRPFNLLLFVLNKPDEWMLDKIRLSIDMKPETEQGIKYLKEHNEEHSEDPIRLINLAYVKPNIPLSIDYYTYYPNPETGEFETWPDRYEYDIQIIKAIKPFLPKNVHQ
jgi:murein L,D-transpeptidase YcbB/YkuD